MIKGFRLFFSSALCYFSYSLSSYGQEILSSENLLMNKIRQEIVNEKLIGDVIVVDFFRGELDGNCYIEISGSPIYYECCLKSYQIVEGKLIAFYDWRSYCSTGFLSDEKTQPEIDGFKSFEKCSRIPPFESDFVRYRIIDFETLEFVNRGKK